MPPSDEHTRGETLSIQIFKLRAAAAAAANSGVGQQLWPLRQTMILAAREVERERALIGVRAKT